MLTHTNNSVQNGFVISPFFDLLGVEVLESAENEILIKLPLKEELINLRGTLHGGVQASMLDLILYYVIKSETKLDSVTVNMNIHYFSPSNKGPMYAKGKVINKGYKLVTAEGEIYDAEDKLISKGMGTFKLLRK